MRTHMEDCDVCGGGGRQGRCPKCYGAGEYEVWDDQPSIPPLTPACIESRHGHCIHPLHKHSESK